jgi:vacuolar-type H+-ATPase subunit H
VLAQRTADATIKEAKEEANRVLSEAREEAARTRAEAEAEARRGADSARVNAQAEVETLLANRDRLKSDLDALTRRIDDQRNQLRSGINEMQRLLDDPSALKPLPPLSLADVDLPTPLPPVAEPADERNGNGNGQHADQGELPDVTELHESPAPPPVDLGPPTQAVPFALSGDTRGGWLPSELRSPADEPLGPPPAPPAPDADSAQAVAPEPGSRPSEWGRAVFEPEPADGEHSRFGRRR